MILLVLALLGGAFWYILDRELKADFLPYLKWPVLAFIVLLALTEVFMFTETDRMIEAHKISDTNGITFSAWDNSTNTTVSSYMWKTAGGDDQQVLMTYHKLDYWGMQFMLELLPYSIGLIAFGIVMQVVLVWYDVWRGAGGKKE